MAINKLVYPVVHMLNYLEKEEKPNRVLHVKTEHYMENKFHGDCVTISGKFDYCIVVAGMRHGTI